MWAHLRHLVPSNFQWYKEFFNLMGFDPYNCSLKIQESIGTPTPKMGVHFGVWGFIPSHSPTLPRAWNVTLGLHSWPAPSQALALVVSPRLGLQHHRYAPCLEIKLYPKNSWKSLENLLAHPKCISHLWPKCNLEEFLRLERSLMDSKACTLTPWPKPN